MKPGKKITFFIIFGIAVLIDFIATLVNKPKGYDVKSILELAFIILDLSGIFFEFKKGSAKPFDNKPAAKNFRLKVSFSGAIYGGFTGGALSGAILLLFYCTLPGESFSQCSVIISYCAAAGCLIGGLVDTGIKLLSRVFLNRSWAHFAGCFAGCLTGALLSGIFGMYLLEQDQGQHFFGQGKIITGSALALPGIIPGILAYNYDGKKKYIIFPLIAALFVSGIISLIAYWIFGTEAIKHYLLSKDLIKTGLAAGLMTGFVFGLVAGFTWLFYRFMGFAEKQEDRIHFPNGFNFS